MESSAEYLIPIPEETQTDPYESGSVEFTQSTLESRERMVDSPSRLEAEEPEYRLTDDQLRQLEREKHGIFPYQQTRELVKQYEPTVGSIELDQDGQLYRSYLKYEGFSRPIINIYNEWINYKLPQTIMDTIIEIPSSTTHGNPSCYTFDNVRRSFPMVTYQRKPRKMFPDQARRNNLDYTFEIRADIYYTQYDKDGRPSKSLMRSQEEIAQIPVMLGSEVCYLAGKNPAQLRAMGEDPDDPLGYFIINGSEKVLLIQEQLRRNKIIVYRQRSAISPVCRMMVSKDDGIRSAIVISHSKQRVIKLTLNAFRPKVNIAKGRYTANIFHVFYIYLSAVMTPEAIEGIQEFNISDYVMNFDQVIDTYILPFIQPKHRAKCLSLLMPTIHKYYVCTDIIAYFARKLDISYVTNRTADAANLTLRRISQAIHDNFYPHLNYLSEDPEIIRHVKLYMFGIMIARFLENMAGYRKADNRDSWSNKWLGSAGDSMDQLFVAAWRKVIQKINKNIADQKAPNIIKLIRENKVTNLILSSFRSNIWGVQGSKAKTGYVEEALRNNLTALYSQIRTINVPVSDTNKVDEMRKVQGSQYNNVCYVETPEGRNIGVRKNLAATTILTTDKDDANIINALYGAIPGFNHPYVELNYHESYDGKVMVNGKFLGWCHLEETYQYCIQQRRENKLFYKDTGIIKEGDFIYIHTDGSRMVSPLLIVEDNELVIDRKGLRGQPLRVLEREGALEYIDVWEFEHIKLAYSSDMLRAHRDNLRQTRMEYANNQLAMEQLEAQLNDSSQVYTESERRELESQLETVRIQFKSNEYALQKILDKRPFTHAQMHASSSLGIAASLLPFMNHNQSPRNLLGTAHIKQALGTYHLHQRSRFDRSSKTLAYPCRPLEEGIMNEVIGLHRHPQGENLIVAFMSFTGHEIEDGFVFNQASIDMGKLMFQKSVTYEAKCRVSGDAVEQLAKPQLKRGENPQRYAAIQDNGIPKIGSFLEYGDCVIGKTLTSTKTKIVRNTSIYISVGEQGYVENIHVSSNGDTTTIKVKVTTVRNQQKGDKLAPPNAQKGTIGLILPPEDMPYTKDGIRPDIIVNPICVAGRMTMSYLMMVIAGKNAAVKASRINATSFDQFDYNTYYKTLVENGFHPRGYEYLYNGMTGKPFKNAMIFMGPVYFQALKHHVVDKIQGRQIDGARDPLTGQPAKGRAHQGGLRLGEMEGAASVAHGSSYFLNERTLKLSDQEMIIVCKSCGTRAVYRADTGKILPCQICGEEVNFGRLLIPRTYSLVVNMLAGEMFKISHTISDVEKTITISDAKLDVDSGSEASEEEEHSLSEISLSDEGEEMGEEMDEEELVEFGDSDFIDGDDDY